MTDGWPEHYRLFRPLEAIRHAAGRFLAHCAIEPMHSDHYRGAAAQLDHELYDDLHETADGVEAWNQDQSQPA